MAKSKAALETEIRNDILSFLTESMSAYFDADVLDISASELVMPVVDAEGNEKYALIKVSIPRGSRDGNGGYNAYNGYAAHEEWEMEKADKADKEAKRKEKAERAEKEKERKREARKVVKKLNTVGFNTLITQKEDE